MESTTSLTRQIHLHLLIAGDHTALVPTTLSYDPADPYAVHATMHADESVDWTFSRELLHEGLQAPAGLGDVHVAPGTDERGRAVLNLVLSSPDGGAVLHGDPAEFAAFLSDTVRVVPFGGESAHLDLDATLALLVADS